MVVDVAAVARWPLGGVGQKHASSTICARPHACLLCSNDDCVYDVRLSGSGCMCVACWLAVVAAEDLRRIRQQSPAGLLLWFPAFATCEGSPVDCAAGGRRPGRLLLGSIRQTHEKEEDFIPARAIAPSGGSEFQSFIASQCVSWPMRLWNTGTHLCLCAFLCVSSMHEAARQQGLLCELVGF